MKIIKPRYDLVFFFFLPFFILSTFFYFFYFQQLPSYLAGGNILFSLCLLLLLFFPQSSQSLGTKTTKASIRWVLSLFISQLLMNTLVWSFTWVINQGLGGNELLNLNLIKLSLSAGFFPWGFSTFFALTLGYFTYRKAQLGLVSSSYQPLFKNTHLDSVGIVVDSYMRFLPLCVSIFLLAMLSIAMVLLIQQFLPFPSATGLNFKIYFISSALLLLVSNQWWVKIVHKLMYYKTPTLTILIGFALLISLLFPLLSVISQALVNLNPSLANSLFESNVFSQQYKLIFIVFWWLALGALTGAYIAFISRDKTIRQVIMGSLVSFLLTLGVIFYLDRTVVAMNYSQILPLTLLIVSSTIMIIFMLIEKNITYFLRATLPQDQPIKPRSTFRFLKIVPLATVALICGFFGKGNFVWSYLAVAGLIPPFTIMLISFIGFLKNFLAPSPINKNGRRQE